jgi:hypothetical protein
MCSSGRGWQDPGPDGFSGSGISSGSGQGAKRRFALAPRSIPGRKPYFAYHFQSGCYALYKTWDIFSSDHTAFFL